MAERSLTEPLIHSHISIRPIDPESTASIRHAVLWPSIPLDSQLLPFDILGTTTHYGAFLGGVGDSEPIPANGGELIGCLTVTLEQYRFSDRLPPSVRERNLLHYQLHKFAVLQKYQGRGIGRQLLQRSMEILMEQMQGQEQNILLHFDARASQIGFYTNLGFELLDSERFIKRGSTGQGDPVEYVRMGKILD